MQPGSTTVGRGLLAMKPGDLGIGRGVGFKLGLALVLKRPGCTVQRSLFTFERCLVHAPLGHDRNILPETLDDQPDEWESNAARAPAAVFDPALGSRARPR